MQIRRLSLLDGAREARGIAVVIDVFRAFSVEPVLFALGADRIVLEEDVEACLAWRDRAVLVGEVNGLPIDGFDLTNSPYQVLRAGAAVFAGRTVVHRTTAGVRGALAAFATADEVLLASFMTAGATARYVLAQRPDCVSIVAMGDKATVAAPEDDRCADCIEALLGGPPYDHLAAIDEILHQPTAEKFLRGDKPYFPQADPLLCLQRDLFDFPLRAVRTPDGLEARPVGKAA
ncbi:MAG: 2-phosphosulfolactate phosphatase [Rhodospirillaceae bacterium]|nr:2-phosphosulfolactate phosphatase [Rhodospirillaceae bacterium]